VITDIVTLDHRNTFAVEPNSALAALRSAGAAAKLQTDSSSVVRRHAPISEVAEHGAWHISFC
jgi:hypothetical protein